LEHIIAWLRRYGITRLAINLHYKPETITSHFGNGCAFGVAITYSYEDPILGTAGAARKLQDFLGDGSFLVVYGDVLTNLDLAALHAFHQGQLAADGGRPGLTMALYHVPNPTEVGLVGLAAPDGGRVTRFVEKPRPEQVFTDLANAGVLVVEPGILDAIPAGIYYDFGHDLFPRLLAPTGSGLAEGAPLYGWPLPKGTYLIDIGSPEKYQRVQEEWPLIAGD
jgi:NDP-sugar pyrophosphorylase family protein